MVKVEDFSPKRQPVHIPGQMTVDEVIQEIEQETVYTSLTPSGIEVAYSPAPRRHYKVRKWMEGSNSENDHPLSDWQEVPSVTTVLGVLDKPALTWWGMKIGVEGVQAVARKALNVYRSTNDAVIEWITESDIDRLVNDLTANKLTVNHVKDKAADRGTSVHKAFEAWCENPEYRPDPELFEENERGYIVALGKFIEDIDLDTEMDDTESEVMVGSIEHCFAGRYDCRLEVFGSPKMVVKAYPKREARRDLVPEGSWLLDLKTSKSVYATHALQLAAYELASVECGYGPTDYRAVLHLQADGQYELVQTHATAEDFLSVLQVYQTMQKARGWT